MASPDAFSPGEVEVTLDGLSVEIPFERRSLAGVRSHLESLALQQQRILCSLSVDGEQINLTQSRNTIKRFSRVDAETMSLSEVPAQLIKAALQQTVGIRSRVQSAVELVLINEIQPAREIWWHLVASLKEPLLTLSLLPETICKPGPGGASLFQLRKWQLQQLGCVIQDADLACRSDDPAALSDALETRVLPWLDNLHESLQLWHEMISSDSPAAASQNA